jgi:cysteine desulfurase
MHTEHKAVRDAFRALEKEGFAVNWLAPRADGVLDLDVLRAALREDTQLVSVMHVNNETGVTQDIEAIGGLCRERGVLFHTDAAQSVGKLPLDLGTLPVDLLALSGHKFYGPQGIGALYIADRPGCSVAPLLHGGGQERRLRPGTLPVHQIVGIGVAAELAAARQADDLGHVRALRERLWEDIRGVPGVHLNGAARHTYPGILNVSVEGVHGESLLLALEPISVARGSACNAQSAESSHVLRALGRGDALAQSAIRFSFGRPTRPEDVARARDAYISAVAHLRALAPPPAAAGAH